MAELSSSVEEETPPKWPLSVDVASNMNWSSTRVILEVLGDILIEKALKFEFPTSNNQ